VVDEFIPPKRILGIKIPNLRGSDSIHPRAEARGYSNFIPKFADSVGGSDADAALLEIYPKFQGQEMA